MPNLLRDTVQGALNAAGHVIWLIDWHTRGAAAARPAARRA